MTHDDEQAAAIGHGGESSARREVLCALGGAAALLLAAPAAPAAAPAAFAAASHDNEETTRMTLTCFIRYEIDPYQLDAFTEYAANWGRIIPRCGGHLVGYFLPAEGTNNIGWGLIAFDSLAAYERYRARIKADADGKANFAAAQAKRFIVREERTFVRVVEGTFGLPATAVP